MWSTIRMIPLSQPGRAQTEGRLTITGKGDSRTFGSFTRLLTPGILYCLEVGSVTRRWKPQLAVVKLDGSSPKTAAGSIRHNFEFKGSERLSTIFLGAAATMTPAEKGDAESRCKTLTRFRSV